MVVEELTPFGAAFDLQDQVQVGTASACCAHGRNIKEVAP